MTPRHRATILFLLRNHAAQQRFTHGPLIERPGGIELTPVEMEAWADEIESSGTLEPQTLPGNSPDWMES